MTADNTTLTLEESKALVLEKMRSLGTMNTSDIGYTAFPNARFKTPQGAARAAGRIIKELIADGSVNRDTDYDGTRYKMADTFVHKGRVYRFGEKDAARNFLEEAK